MSQLKTGFLPGPNGSLHIALFHPGEASASLSWVVHVPAFGEEMNKSRGMVARQARALAGQGVTVLVPDLFGTGDSAGSLEAASWQAWRDDITYLAEWARGQGAVHLTLWGHRMGCLLAADVAQALPPEQLLFWQPVHSGKQHMAQFLRLRMAAGLATGGTETVAQLRERLLQGESLEVAGYTLPGGLFIEIESVALAQLAVPIATRVGILEVVSEAGKPVLPVTAKLVEQWIQLGIGCSAETATGDPFWMTQELAFSPVLIEKTATCLVPVGEVSGENYGSTNPQSGQPNVPGDALQAILQNSPQAVVFSCGDEQLAGILHHAKGNSTLGVLIVVGGPQYRVGSHRQFVYLAQHLAAEGIPVLRFDYRGMGDSSGELRGFEHINLDICSAINVLQRKSPCVTDIVIWGLCDAATAAIFYGPGDARVKGLVLANPWVFSEQGAAKAYLKHYYLQRLLQREFWGKIFSGNYRFSSSVSSAWGMLKGAVVGRSKDETLVIKPETGYGADTTADAQIGHPAEPLDDLVTRFTIGMAQFKGDIFFILSGNDLTAAEFVDATRSNNKLRRLMKRGNVSQVTLSNVDHTFSRDAWRGEVEMLTLNKLKRIYGG